MENPTPPQASVQELPPAQPSIPEQLPSQPETAQQLAARLTQAWDRQAARINTAVTDGTIPPDHPFVREYSLLQDAKNKVNGNTFNESDQSFTIDGVDPEGNPIKVPKNERESIDPFFDAAAKLPEDIQGNQDITLLKENTKVYVEGREDSISYSKWEADEKQPPGVRFDIEAKRPKIETNQQDSSETSKAKTSEVAETLRDFVDQTKLGLEIEYRAMTNGFDVDFNVLPSENRKINEANPGYARTIIQKARPGVNYDNISAMSDEAVLTDRYQQDAIMNETLKQAIERLGEPVTPEQKAELRRIAGEQAFINGEQERIRGYLGNPKTIDISRVNDMFKPGGILSKPEQQAKFLKNNEMLKQQMENFAEQHEAFKKGLAVSFTLPNGKEVNITKKDLKNWGSTAAMITGISMFLLYLEGDKDKPQAGGGMH